MNTNTISEEVRRKVESGLGNNLLTDLRVKKQIGNLGFSSVAPRFQDKKTQEAEAFLGPGYYEQSSTFEQKKSVGVSSTLKNPSFAPRMIEGTKKTQETTPGPGHYSNEDLTGWYKRSYNMIFTE